MCSFADVTHMTAALWPAILDFSPAAIFQAVSGTFSCSLVGLALLCRAFCWASQCSATNYAPIDWLSGTSGKGARAVTLPHCLSRQPAPAVPRAVVTGPFLVTPNFTPKPLFTTINLQLLDPISAELLSAPIHYLTYSLSLLTFPLPPANF